MLSVFFCFLLNCDTKVLKISVNLIYYFSGLCYNKIMKQKVIEFFKNKLNMALIILQTLALISFSLCELFVFFLVMFFVFESAFLIVWGVKFIVANKDARYKLEIYDQLPYTSEQREVIRKNSENNSKNNKMMAVMLILFGIVLFFSGISMIF